MYSDILRSKLLRINETLKVHYLRKCWGHRTVYMGDLPPSVTEEWVRELVGNIGVYSYMKVSSYFCVLVGLSTLAKVGVNVKDGGKYAFLGMESREAGDAVIEALHLQVTITE